MSDSDDSANETAHAKRIMAVHGTDDRSAFPDTLAGLLYTLQCATACAESALGDKLSAADIPWQDHSYDYYDCSLEIHGVGDWVPTPEQIAAVGAMGFTHFWTRVGSKAHEPGEKHYGCRGTPVSTDTKPAADPDRT